MPSTPQESSRFPTIVGWVSLILALWLFFGNTVPALREHKQLQQTEADLQQLRSRYDSALEHLRASTNERGRSPDLQSVLVAIAQIGWTPQELLRNYPAEPLAEDDQ